MVDKNSEKTADPSAKDTAVYNREQLLRSAAFAGRRDLLNALLTEERRYTKAEVVKMIEAYDRKEV